jgi:SAM-dependent methyltransferase
MPDPRERFTGTVDNYEKYRPSYPPELIEWIVATSGIPPRGVIVDVGCGTGLSTRLFGSRGFEVIGIDPNEAMLARASAAGGAAYRKGEAAATGLEPGSVDLIVGGQSFHWFDLAPTFREFRRILRPAGGCAAFWNVRSTEEPFLEEYEAILRRHSADYATVGRHDDAIPRVRAHPEVEDPREAAFSNRVLMDFDGVLGRAWSSSYVVHGVKDKTRFDAELKSAFDRHQRNGAVPFVYRTEVIAWRLTPLPNPAGSA